MILEEKGVMLNIPDGLRWEKFDKEDFYRNISHLGLKAVDFIFYGHKKIVLLEIKNYVPNLEESIQYEDLIERKKQEIEKRLSVEKVIVQLVNKLVSSVYLLFGKKLKEPKEIIFCALLILPQSLKSYLTFITSSLSNLATGERNLLKVNVSVLDDIGLAEKIITSIYNHD